MYFAPVVEFYCLCDVSYYTTSPIDRREQTSFKYIAVIAKGRHAKAETARHGRR